MGVDAHTAEARRCPFATTTPTSWTTGNTPTRTTGASRPRRWPPCPVRSAAKRSTTTRSGARTAAITCFTRGSRRRSSRGGWSAVVRLTERRFWRESVSATFHGRDILAPVAGHLSRGLPPDELGPRTSQWVTLNLPAPRPGAKRIEGEVVFVDDFGNLITNI